MKYTEIKKSEKFLVVAKPAGKGNPKSEILSLTGENLRKAIGNHRSWKSKVVHIWRVEGKNQYRSIRFDGQTVFCGYKPKTREQIRTGSAV